MSETGEYDAISALPELIVTDDIYGELPPVAVVDVSYRLAHDQAERLYPYINDAAHEWTGRRPLEITTVLHFNNLLAPGSFPDGWNTWREAIEEGSPKEMQHPLLGELLVVVSSADVTVNSEYRAGVVATVNWLTTILDPEDEATSEPLQLTLQEAAAQVDAAMDEVDIEFPSGYVATSFTEFMAQLNSFSFLIELQVGGIVGQVKQIIGQVHDLVTSDPALSISHARAAVLDTLTQLYGVCLDVQERATLGARATSQLTTNSPTTFDAIAADTGNAIEELFGLNFELLSSPVIPAGATVKFYA